MNTYFYKDGIIPEYFKISELIILMQTAVEQFNQEEKFLLKNNYQEESISHRLALHIDDLIRNNPKYQDMYVGIEYGKGADGNERASKYLVDPNKNIRLDLVVSSRVYDDLYGYHNLICVEIKKQSNRRNKAWEKDQWRLQQLTSLDRGGRSLYGYFVGFFIVINEKEIWIEKAYDQKGEIPKDDMGKIYIPDNRYTALYWEE